MQDELNTKEERPLSVWMMFGVFVVLFLIGTYLLYSWWLNPWLTEVNNRDLEVVVPGVKETDSDGDGLSLEYESRIGTSDNMTDSDGDRLADDEEVEMGTDPLNKDTDGDGYLDGEEVDNDFDPLK